MFLISEFTNNLLFNELFIQRKNSPKNMIDTIDNGEKTLTFECSQVQLKASDQRKKMLSIV